MWLIAGLGNPGKRYEATRHNVGFEVVDELRSHHMQAAYRTKFGGLIVNGFIGTEKVALLKPMEFMNRSGDAVQKACRFYDIPVEKVVVIHDELDLPPGRLRLKSGGGHGGNNGLRSIISCLGSKDFLRVRVGIGKPTKEDGSPGESGANYVLSPFPKDLHLTMQDAKTRAADAVRCILEEDMTQAMNSFNGVSQD